MAMFDMMAPFWGMMFWVALSWLIAIILWLWALIDCLKKPEKHFKGKNDKLIWIIVIVFTFIIGAVIYLFAGRKK